jgi:hypothetical protein
MKLFFAPLLSSALALLAVDGHRRLRLRRGKVLGPLLPVFIVLGAIGAYWVYQYVQWAKVGLAYGDTQAGVGGSLATYTHNTGHLPHDIGGLSWRVEMLRDDGDINDRALYRRFRLDEPWDSPHNKLLIEQIPWWLQDPEGKKGETCYRGVRGKDCAFDDGKEVKPPPPAEPTNVVAVVITKEFCPWTKPADAPVADVEQGNCLRWFRRNGGHTRADAGEDAYTDLITSAGGQIGCLRSNLPGIKHRLRFADATP